MDEQINKLHVGEILSNAEIVDTFKVGNMGGMRRSKATNTLVIVSDPYKAFYDDKWDGNTLHYTGMGKHGDQLLDGTQNRTLNESGTNGVGVHLFEVFNPKQYTYIGPISLVSPPYQQQQNDVDGKSRKVWVFPVQVTGRDAPIISKEAILNREEIRGKDTKKATDAEVRDRAAKSGSKTPSQRTSTATIFERNPWVVEHAKRRAKGVCELCNANSPFITKKGEPCLETHHIVWLAKGGEDTIENTVALCPNCHRKIHSLKLKEDFDALQRVAK